MLAYPLTNNLRLHGKSYSGHGKQGEDRLVEALVLKHVSSEVDGEEVTLGAHTGNVPEGHISLTHHKLTPAEHDAIYT